MARPPRPAARPGPASRPRRRACRSRPACPVVDAKLTLHPELHGVGTQTIAAPMGGPRHIHSDPVGFGGAGAVIGNAETARRGGDAAFERLTRFHGLALLAGPRTEAALPGPGAKVRVVLRIRERFHGPLHAHLPVAVIPVKYQCGAAGGRELPALPRSIV